MTETERLAALLHDAAIFCELGDAQAADFIYHHDQAARLIAAGVTFRAETPGLDVDRLARAIRSNWYEIRPTGGEWLGPVDAAHAIAREYAALAHAIAREYAALAERKPDTVHVYPSGEDHLTDGTPCWCNPYPDSIEPLVTIHRKAGTA